MPRKGTSSELHVAVSRAAQRRRERRERLRDLSERAEAAPLRDDVFAQQKRRLSKRLAERARRRVDIISDHSSASSVPASDVESEREACTAQVGAPVSTIYYQRLPAAQLPLSQLSARAESLSIEGPPTQLVPAAPAGKDPLLVRGVHWVCKNPATAAGIALCAPAAAAAAVPLVICSAVVGLVFSPIIVPTASVGIAYYAASKWSEAKG